MLTLASKHVWNRSLDAIRKRIVQLALNEPELSPRELATHFTDTANYFVSEASGYRLLKAHNLITSPNSRAVRFYKNIPCAPRASEFLYTKT
jgi:putative transposase